VATPERTAPNGRRGADLGPSSPTASPGQGPGQRARALQACSTLPHGLRARPAPMARGAGSRGHPHTRAHSTTVSPASSNSRPSTASRHTSPPVPSRSTAAPQHKPPYKGSAGLGGPRLVFR
jgi:hypothetical protein